MRTVKSFLQMAVVWWLSVNVGFAMLFEPTDLDLDGLLGPVRAVEEEHADVTLRNGSPVESARRLAQTSDYDRQGRLTRSWSRHSAFDASDLRFFYGGDNSRVAIIERTNSQTAGSTASRFPDQRFLATLHFDSRSNTFDERRYMNEHPIAALQECEQVLHSEAVLIRQNEACMDLTQRYSHIFDANGRIVEKKTWGFAGLVETERGEMMTLMAVLQRDIYVYGDGDHPAAKYSYVLNDLSGISRYSYILDSVGNWIQRTEERTTQTPNGIAERTEVIYRKIRYY